MRIKCSVICVLVYLLQSSLEINLIASEHRLVPSPTFKCFLAFFQTGPWVLPFVPSLSFTMCGESNSASTKDCHFPVLFLKQWHISRPLVSPPSETLGKGGLWCGLLCKRVPAFAADDKKGQITSEASCPYNTLLERCSVLSFGEREAFLKRGQRTVRG